MEIHALGRRRRRYPEGAVSTSMAAEILGVSEKTVYRMIKRQALRPVKVAGRWRFTQESLYNLLSPKSA
jgi:excisionase family DNA binding protein